MISLSLSRCAACRAFLRFTRMLLLYSIFDVCALERRTSNSSGAICSGCFHVIIEVAGLDATSQSSTGSFIVEVQPGWCPLGAARVREIASNRVWREARFFRVLPGFVVQWGIPGVPELAHVWRGRTIQDDPVRVGLSNKRGAVTFAMGGRNTRTTQVFVNLADNSELDSQGFPPFGEVVEGMDVIDRITALYRERPNQGMIESRGNKYLQAKFPRLSYVQSVTLVEGSYLQLNGLNSTLFGDVADLVPGSSVWSLPVMGLTLLAASCGVVLLCNIYHRCRQSKGNTERASGPGATQIGVAE